MTCEELRGEYGAWALGIAEDPARSEIAAHLARECVAAVGVSAALAIALLLSVVVTRRPNQDTTKLAQALSILNDPVAKDVTFGDLRRAGAC